MSESKHTGGPLTMYKAGPNVWLKSDDRTVAFIGGGDSVFTAVPDTPHIDNAARLVACWNACEGIDPEAVPVLIAALENLLAYANKYSDVMADKHGHGAEELGELAPSESVGGMARAAIWAAAGKDPMRKDR